MQHHVFHLHPLGWASGPDKETIPLSTLDYLPPCLYNNYVLFFRLDDADKSRMVALLKSGLERTLSQARHLCGTVEKDAVTGDHAFIIHRDSTVQLHVQWLDLWHDSVSPYPSFSELEAHSFSSTVLGDLGLWSVAPMTHGIKPEAHINNSPAVSAFKASFIPGGLVFNMHVHHCSNDVMGWAGFTHQLAENCRAIHLKDETAYPSWDPACLDRSRLMAREAVPEEAKVNAPAPDKPHPDLLPVEPLLFHLPASKAARLKAMATPPADGIWISTFDAFSAFIWRTLLRVRAKAFKVEPSTPLVWMAPVDMRRRLRNPPCPPRTQGNVFTIARSTATAQFVADSPLWEVASFIRQTVASGATQAALDARLDAAAAVRDKTSLFLRADTLSPLAMIVTDWRATDIAAADFGLARPAAFRHVSDDVTRCVVQVYPPRGAPGEDQGCEFAITFEKSIAPALIEDAEWSEFFEYRGIV